MFARDQNLLLQPEVNPSVGLRCLNRCVQLAGAWRRLGGNATLVHRDLPGRLVRQLRGLSIGLLPLADMGRVVSDLKPGWLFVDGTSGQPSLECLSLVGADLSQRWKLAATEKWVEANGTRFQSPDVLISPAPDALSRRSLRAGRILSGARYQMPESGGPLASFKSDAIVVPSVARKILIWLNEENSDAVLAQALADVIDVASERTSVEVVASLKRRDSSAMVQLKKANPGITIRFWASIDRRLQSMAPIHLAIVDGEGKSQALAVKGIPVVCLNGTNGVEGVDDRQNSPMKKFSMETTSRAAFRRSLSRLIRNRHQRQSLIDSNPSSQDEQAFDRVTRSLATAELRLESAVPDDWSEISRWQCDPESLASALPSWNQDAAAGRDDFTAALNRPSSRRWMFRLSCGNPIGSASLDPCEPTSNGAARVRILIKPTFRNHGYGTVLLERVIEQVLDDGNVGQVIVQARSTHQAAGRMARKAGLEPVAPTVVDGVVAHQFGIQFERAVTRSTDLIPMQRSA